ncbi:unnamed protein product [Rodentolepis nana]|uniref:60S ribosomal protein L6 n=1 Tax=Rodentolepis nana TaxID=102285 RepID=A0A0R3T6J0_RODNA|nr:unnamed protein product [Rodentolepis nana]
MAAFQKIFYAIDKDNTGVITSVDLRNYMQKMRYKESFVTTWTSLFDPEHTGIITYENYCKVLGLKQENRPPPPPLSETQSNSHAIETQITPTNSEPIRAEHTLHKPEEQNSENSGSQCQRNTDSVSKEDSSLKHHKAQEPSNELNSKTSSVEATEEPREVSGKVSRKRKHAKSPSKENVITPIISKSNVEAHSPKNSGMETKSETMNLEADPQSMESITPQKVDQTLSAKSFQNSKVDGSGKLKKREKEGSHKTLKESSQESPDVESKGADSKEGNSGDVVEGQEKCKESKRKGKLRSPEIKGKELCDGKGEHPGDSGMDIFDFLIESKSNPINIIDEFSDMDQSKSVKEEITPEPVEPVPKSKSKSKSQKSPKPMDVVVEECKETKRKSKSKQTVCPEKKHSDEIIEQPDDGGMDIFDFLISGKDGPIETSYDFDDQPLDKMVSETAELTVTGNPSVFHETKKDKPHQRSKNRSRNASEKSEHIASNALEDISASIKEQQETGGDIFDMLLEAKDHPMETVDDEDMNSTLTVNPEKSFESKSEPLKKTEKSGTHESGSEDLCQVDINGKRSKRSSKPSEGQAIQTLDTSGEKVNAQKHQIGIPESSKFKDTMERASDEMQYEVPVKNKGKDQKYEKGNFESSRCLSEVETVPESLGQIESSKKAHQSGKKSVKKREKKSSESSKVEMDIEPTMTSCSLQSIPPTVGNQSRSNPGKIFIDSSESSLTHHESKKATKNKRQKNPSETKSFAPTESTDVEMTTVQEILVPTVETPVRSDNLDLFKMGPKEIKSTPMEIEIVSALTEDQGSSKPPEVTEYVTESKEEKMKFPESDKKKNKEASASATKDQMKRHTEKTSLEQQKSSKDTKPCADKKSKRNKKSSESSPGNKESVPSSASAPHESSMSTIESGIVPMEEVVLEAPVPLIEPKESKRKVKPSESSVLEITENISLAEVPNQEASKNSQQEGETRAPQFAENRVVESELEVKVAPVEQGGNKKPPNSKQVSNSPPDKGETHNVPKSSDELKDDKKRKEGKKTAESTKDSDKRSPTKHEPVVELLSPSISAGLETTTSDSQKEKSNEAKQDEATETKKHTALKIEDLAKPTEFRHELTEQQKSDKKCSESSKKPETLAAKVEIADMAKYLEGSRDDKRNNGPKKQPKPSKESGHKPTIDRKPAEELKSTSNINFIGKQDKPKKSKQKALQNSIEETKATTSKVHNSPSDSTPAKQSETDKTERKQSRRGEKKQSKPLKRTSGESKTSQALGFNEGGLEITNRPLKELKSAKSEDGAESKKRTNKKRKATDNVDDSSSKKCKKVGKNLKKKADDNEKKRKKRKRSQSAKEGDEGTGKKSTKRPRIGNLECGRFPKAFAVQVPHRVAQHRRDGAPISTHALGKAPKGFFTKMSLERRNRNKPNKSIQRWRLRKSLRRVGTVVILLAGRHKGKRAVVIGRHKFSGLLLITGPYKVNGIPIRRVHPDYVIATKTIIKMDKVRCCSSFL